MTSFRKLLIVLALASLILFQTGLAWAQDASQAAKTPAAVEPTNQILFVAPLSGPLADFGLAAKEGAELAMKTWGGGYELLTSDETSSSFRLPPLGRVSVVVGYFYEKNFARDVPYYQLAKQTVILPFLTTGEAAAIKPETIFQLMPSDKKQGEGLALHFLGMKKRPARYLILRGAEPYNQALADSFEAALANPPAPRPAPKNKNKKAPPAPKGLGKDGLVVKRDIVSAADLATVNEFGDKKPEVVVLAVNPKLATELAFKFKPLEFSAGWIYLGCGLATRELGAIYLSQDLKTAFFLPVNMGDDTSKRMKEFSERYLNHFNKKPTWPAAMAYDAMALALKAMAVANDEQDARDVPTYLNEPDLRHDGLASYLIVPGESAESPMKVMELNAETLSHLP